MMEEKRLFIYKMEYYTAFKKKEVPYPMTWMKLEDIMLSKTIQSWSTNISHLLISVIKIVMLREGEYRVVDAGAGEEEIGVWLLGV